MLTAKDIPALRKRLANFGFPQVHQRSSVYAGQETASAEKNPTLDEWLTQYETASKDVSVEQRRQHLINTLGSFKGLQEWAEAIRLLITKDVLAHNFSLNAFFETVTLAPSDRPVLETRSRDGKFKFSYVGQNGGRVKRANIETVEFAHPLLQKFSSGWKEFQLVNLQTGDVSESEKVQQELRFEFDHELDLLARALLDDSANLFSSGLRSTLSLHRSIVTANIPDANYLDLSGLGSSGQVTVEKLKQILDYFVRFASDVELDGQPLQIKTIFHSSQNTRDFWDMVDLVAGYNLAGAVQDPKDTLNTEGVAKVWRSGKLDGAFGETWMSVPRNTIEKGVMYIASNKPLGRYYEKPALGGTVFKEGQEVMLNNTGAVKKFVTHSFVVPQAWAYRYLKVQL